ncbi:uncharacterized protein LOC119375357 [Rhipicephalus sanguineus]|uniref:uncharacterized protein LOC119375357 n=1 Tax=Rhipicephalus sanguineus TaxID=34632 RepID=UPI001894FD22|nr:uncharacterized protein LOC119375357 [Rhipicephalus sanguineus]
MNWIPLLFLLCGYCQGSSDTSIEQNRSRRTVYPLWKPAARKAYDLCGPDLKDNAPCKLPPWCAGGAGRCCRRECVCPTRLNPCASPEERTTTASPTTTEGAGHCMLKCMEQCYKMCLDGTKTPGECANEKCLSGNPAVDPPLLDDQDDDCFMSAINADEFAERQRDDPEFCGLVQYFEGKTGSVRKVFKRKLASFFLQNDFVKNISPLQAD